MKFTRENGDVVECSVEEYKELLSLEAKVTENKSPWTQEEKPKRKYISVKLSEPESIETFETNGEIDITQKRKNKSWTQEEIDYLLENTVTKTNIEIGKKLGRTPHAIAVKLWDLKNKNLIPSEEPNTKLKKSPRRRFSSCRKWSNNELKILIDNKDKFAFEIAKLLPNRSTAAVNTMRLKLEERGVIDTSKQAYWKTMKISKAFSGSKKSKKPKKEYNVRVGTKIGDYVKAGMSMSEAAKKAHKEVKQEMGRI